MNVGLIGSLIIAFAISLPYVFWSFQSEPVTRSVTISGQLKTEGTLAYRRSHQRVWIAF